jgi:hypothetical protein
MRVLWAILAVAVTMTLSGSPAVSDHELGDRAAAVQRHVAPAEADGQAAVSYCAEALASGINDAGIDGSAWALRSLGLPREADGVTFTKTAADTYELAWSEDGNMVHKTFEAGALVMQIIGNAGDVGKRGDLQVIGLVGPTLTRCTEAAFVLTGQSGNDLGRELRKRFDDQFGGGN